MVHHRIPRIKRPKARMSVSHYCEDGVQVLSAHFEPDETFRGYYTEPEYLTSARQQLNDNDAPTFLEFVGDIDLRKFEIIARFVRITEHLSFFRCSPIFIEQVMRLALNVSRIVIRECHLRSLSIGHKLHTLELDSVYGARGVVTSVADTITLKFPVSSHLSTATIAGCKRLFVVGDWGNGGEVFKLFLPAHAVSDLYVSDTVFSLEDVLNMVSLPETRCGLAGRFYKTRNSVQDDTLTNESSNSVLQDLNLELLTGMDSRSIRRVLATCPNITSLRLPPSSLNDRF